MCGLNTLVETAGILSKLDPQKVTNCLRRVNSNQSMWLVVVEVWFPCLVGFKAKPFGKSVAQLWGRLIKDMRPFGPKAGDPQAEDVERGCFCLWTFVETSKLIGHVHFPIWNAGARVSHYMLGIP